MTRPRVAFFTDSFHEVNGVAQTSRQFDAFARRWQIPFLRVNVEGPSGPAAPLAGWTRASRRAGTRSCRVPSGKGYVVRSVPDPAQGSSQSGFNRLPA